MLMVEFFSGDWLPSHCLFFLSQNLLSSTVKVRGEKCRLDEIKFAKKIISTLVNFKLFPRASKIFKSRKICPHLVQNVTNRKSRLKKECSTREFYYTAWASQNFSIRLIIDLESYGHKSFLKFWNCTFEAIKFTIYQCRNVAKTRKNGNPKSVFSQTTII